MGITITQHDSGASHTLLSLIKRAVYDVAMFAQRTVKAIVLVLGTLAFPATAIGAGIKCFYQTRHQDIPRSVRAKSILAIILLPIPIIGINLFHELGEPMAMQGMRAAPTKMKCLLVNDIVLSIPFVSSLYVATYLFSNMFE